MRQPTKKHKTPTRRDQVVEYVLVALIVLVIIIGALR